MSHNSGEAARVVRETVDGAGTDLFGALRPAQSSIAALIFNLIANGFRGHRVVSGGVLLCGDTVTHSSFPFRNLNSVGSTQFPYGSSSKAASSTAFATHARTQYI